MQTIESYIKETYNAEHIKSRYHPEDWPKINWKFTEAAFRNWQGFSDVVDFAMDFDDLDELDDWINKQRNQAHKTTGILMGFIKE